LPAPIAAQVRDHAFEAFVSASHVAALIAAVAAIVATVIVATMLPRDIPVHREAPVAPQPSGSAAVPSVAVPEAAPEV
jgi:hypothetical protein